LAQALGQVTSGPQVTITTHSALPQTATQDEASRLADIAAAKQKFNNSLAQLAQLRNSVDAAPNTLTLTPNANQTMPAPTKVGQTTAATSSTAATNPTASFSFSKALQSDAQERAEMREIMDLQLSDPTVQAYMADPSIQHTNYELEQFKNDKDKKKNEV
jgi:hypothetical protein